MSSRGLDAGLVSHLDGRVVRPVWFLQLEFDSPTGTLYLHDRIGDLIADDWDGVERTWSGLGELAGIEGVEEGSDVTPRAAAFVLSGIDSEISSQVLTDDSVLRRAYLLVSGLNDQRQLVADPQRLWSGDVDDLQVRCGAENAIRAVCESHLVAFERSNGRLFNDADHQEEFGGDLAFEYLEQMIDARVVWGGDTKDYRTGVGSSFVVGGPFTGAGAGGGFGGFGSFDQR